MKESKDNVRVIKTPPFKLKSEEGKNKQVINVADMGFVPDTIVIEKLLTEKNMFVIYGLEKLS